MNHQFTGALATPEVVGRESHLRAIEKALKQQEGLSILFFTGEGGIGKTRLLTEALRMAEKQPGLRTAHPESGVLDLYHISLHTALGLMQGIYEALTPPRDAFHRYEVAYRELNQMRLVGEAGDIAAKQRQVEETFMGDLRQLAQRQRLVLAIDTAERAIYGLPGWHLSELELAEGIRWLLKQLQPSDNLTLFIAGRPRSKPLLEELQKRYPGQVEEMAVAPFTLEESLSYLEAVRKMAEEKGERQIAERLKMLPEEIRTAAHHYSAGRPIWLALFIGFLSVAGAAELPEALRRPATEISETTRKEFEEQLLDRLIRSPLGDTLLALGRAPKGVDPPLLALLLDIPEEKARERLQQVLGFAFVKKRQADQRLFLHDELYELFARRVFQSPYDSRASQKAFEAFKTYYQNRLEENTHLLDRLFAPLDMGGEGHIERERINEALLERQKLLIERMYYFLHFDFGRGLRHYFRYTQEALLSHDALMDLQLEAELLDFLSTSQNEYAQKFVDEMPLSWIEDLFHLRPVMRLWAQSQYDGAIEHAHTLLKEKGKDWEQSSPMALILLHTWTAYAHVMRGTREDRSEAKHHLEKAFQLANVVEGTGSVAQARKLSSTATWTIKLALGLAYRISGYLNRIQGTMEQAIEDYRKANQIFRQIDVRVELATTLNDMGFALASSGHWSDGRALVQDALTLRRELGPRAPVALSLNTLGAIDVQEGQYLAAQTNSERALAIFRFLQYPRGVGMALTTLAEATRRHAVTAQMLSGEDRIDGLRRARDYAQEARAIFSETQESERLVAALIELGCAYRDWLHLRRQEGVQGREDLQRLHYESRDALERAATLAQEQGILYREIDARVNLAWLEFYRLERGESIGEDHPLRKALEESKNRIPAEYLIDPQSKRPSIAPADAQPLIWPQIGKWYVLQGHLEFFQLEQVPAGERKAFSRGGQSQQIEAHLQRLAEAYAYGLEYNSLYVPDHQGVRRAREEIYERLKRLNESELRVLRRRVHEVWPQGCALKNLLINRALWIQEG